MLKKPRSLFCIIVSIAFVFSMGLVSMAASSGNTNAAVPNSDFIRICNQLFAGNGEVYTIDGTEVTNNFVSKYNSAYQSKDYASILSGCYKDDISRIHARKIAEPTYATRAVLQLTYEESVAHLIRQSGFPYDGKSWYLVITASGSYGYQDTTGQIISFPSPTIRASFSDLGALFSGSLDSMKTTAPSINSSKTAASFKVTTTHTVSCPIPGVDYVTGTLGPFTNVSDFTIRP